MNESNQTLEIPSQAIETVKATSNVFTDWFANFEIAEVIAGAWTLVTGQEVAVGFVGFALGFAILIFSWFLWRAKFKAILKGVEWLGDMLFALGFLLMFAAAFFYFTGVIQW